MSLKNYKALFFSIILVILSSTLLTANTTQNLSTPLEKSKYKKLSSHDDLMNYLKEIDLLSNKVTIKTIGRSVEGREIPVAIISKDKVFASNRNEKPVVLIYAQQHGNEPSGKEAALIIIRELSLGSLQDLLQHLDILIVPQVNPDGAEKNQRRNANNMDLNRNHVILSEPESIALHTLFLKWMPEVTVDIHETNASRKNWFCVGYMKDAEENFDCVSNLNIAKEIREFSVNTFIPEVGKLVKKDGFSFSRYIVGGPPEVRRIRHSTTNINDGRQSMGIYNTFSFILEGKRFNDVNSHIKRRTFGQVSAVRAILKTVADHRKEILSITHTARADLIKAKENQLVYLQMDYYPDPEQKTFTYPIFDLYSWKHVEKALDHYEPMVKVKKSVTRPVAYLFSQDQSRLLELLRKHQIELFRLKKDTKVNVEVMTIMDVTNKEEEDKPDVDVTVQTKSLRMGIKKGDYVVFLTQKAGNLIPLLLEPQSSWGICSERSGRKYRFAEFLKKREQYPIYRMVQKTKLSLEKMNK